MSDELSEARVGRWLAAARSFAGRADDAGLLARNLAMLSSSWLRQVRVVPVAEAARRFTDNVVHVERSQDGSVTVEIDASYWDELRSEVHSLECVVSVPHQRTECQVPDVPGRDFATPDDPVRCHLCGKETSVAMIVRHLTEEHDIDPEEIANAPTV